MVLPFSGMVLPFSGVVLPMEAWVYLCWRVLSLRAWIFLCMRGFTSVGVNLSSCHVFTYVSVGFPL